ncbi:MAG TPA: hypothetical protein VE090_04670, partial [Methylomirabilota bacterium]|nr:hypothetical protein [Methylomirabilota bacterium]
GSLGDLMNHADDMPNRQIDVFEKIINPEKGKKEEGDTVFDGMVDRYLGKKPKISTIKQELLNYIEECRKSERHIKSDKWEEVLGHQIMGNTAAEQLQFVREIIANIIEEDPSPFVGSGSEDIVKTKHILVDHISKYQAQIQPHPATAQWERAYEQPFPGNTALEQLIKINEKDTNEIAFAGFNYNNLYNILCSDRMHSIIRKHLARDGRSGFEYQSFDTMVRMGKGEEWFQGAMDLLTGSLDLPPKEKMFFANHYRNILKNREAYWEEKKPK